MPKKKNKSGGMTKDLSKTDKLSDRELLFCELCVKLNNRAEAYRQAGYKCVKHANVKAYQLSQKVHISMYIKHLVYERSMEIKMDTVQIYKNIQSIAANSYAKNTDRLKALELLGKTHKMFIDKVEGDFTHEAMTKEQKLQRIKELKKEREHDEL